MRTLLQAILLSCSLAAAAAAQTPVPAAGPSSAKAQKTYSDALAALKDHRRRSDALDLLRKADKQDGNRCVVCASQIVSLALATGEFKVANEAASELESLATTPNAQAQAHFLHGVTLYRWGKDENKTTYIDESLGQFATASAANPSDHAALYYQALALAALHRDDDARARFADYVKATPSTDSQHRRAARFVNRIDLARQRMAPDFAITTTNGQRLTLEDLTGKVVLVDFWASWCVPCREEEPHLQQLARKLSDQPLVILGVSIDEDNTKWQTYLQKKPTSWPQYLDSRKYMATLFGVSAIPHYFTIDADGVLKEETLGHDDADHQAFDMKLKKLLDRAHEQTASSASTAPRGR